MTSNEFVLPAQKIPKQIRLMLADDHQLVRAGISSLLQLIADVEVVGEATDGNQAVALAGT